MAYANVRKITIDASKIDADLTNFPFLFKGTYVGTGDDPDLRTVGNGGDIQNANGFDLAFFADEALTTPLKQEQEKFVGTTGEVAYWVKILSIDDAVDTDFYLAYGDSGISTSQDDKTNVWDSDYKRVYHFGGTLSLTDSTSQNDTATNHGSVAAGTGQINGGASFPGGTNDYLSFTGVTPSGNTFSREVLFRLAPSPPDGYGTIFTDNGSAGLFIHVIDGSNRRLDYYQGGDHQGSTNIEFDTWYHVLVSVDDDELSVYLNGVLEIHTTGISATTSANIGGYGSAADRFKGILDEYRVSPNAARSAAWAKASYENQINTSSFYSISAVGGGPPPTSNPLLLIEQLLLG